MLNFMEWLFMEKKMSSSILYIGNFDLQDINAAGKRVLNNSFALERLGYSIFLIGKSLQKSKNNSQIKYGEKIFFTTFPNYNRLNFICYFFWLLKFLHKKKISPDVIIQYGSPSFSFFSVLIYIWGKINRIPIVVDIVEWHISMHNSFLFNILKNFDEWLTMFLFNRFSDGMIVISSFLLKYYEKKVKHIVIIPPLVEKYNKPYESSNEVKQIIYAGIPFRLGYLVKTKSQVKDRLDIIIKTISMLNKIKEKVQLHIYGMSREDYLLSFPSHKEIISYAKDSILFHGKKSMQYIQEITRKMDFSILLREKNRNTMSGFSTKIVESMSLGVPVITTDTSDLSKYIKHGENGFFVHIDNESVLQKEILDIIHISNDNLNTIKMNIYENKDFYYMRYVIPFKDFLSHVIKKKII